MPANCPLPSPQLLLLSRFSRVWFCETQQTAAHQAPPSLGFSRQEHWSELPFPSPMHESEKWKWSRIRLFSTLWTAGYQAPSSMGFSRREYWSGVPLPSLLLQLVDTKFISDGLIQAQKYKQQNGFPPLIFWTWTQPPQQLSLPV